MSQVKWAQPMDRIVINDASLSFQVTEGGVICYAAVDSWYRFDTFRIKMGESATVHLKLVAYQCPSQHSWQVYGFGIVHLLRWVPLEDEPEKRMWVWVVYLRGESVKLLWVSGKWYREGRKARKVYYWTWYYWTARTQLCCRTLVDRVDHTSELYRVVIIIPQLFWEVGNWGIYPSNPITYC